MRNRSDERDAESPDIRLGDGTMRRIDEARVNQAACLQMKRIHPLQERANLERVTPRTSGWGHSADGSKVRRGVGIVHDTTQMIVIHAGRLTGVVGTAVACAGDKVNEMVFDCRNIAGANYAQNPDPLDLPVDTGSISIRRTDGPGGPPGSCHAGCETGESLVAVGPRLSRLQHRLHDVLKVTVRRSLNALRECDLHEVGLMRHRPDRLGV